MLALKRKHQLKYQITHNIMATDKRKSLAGRMNDIIGGVGEVKKKTEKGLQSVGSNFSKNIEQGQKDLLSGKVGRYDYINPLKGTRTAFKKGYNSP